MADLSLFCDEVFSITASLEAWGGGVVTDVSTVALEEITSTVGASPFPAAASVTASLVLLSASPPEWGSSDR